MAVKIGGSTGGNRVQKKTFKLKDGDNVYRILPSLGFNGKEPNGRPFQFYNVHFGYKNSEGKMRVFQSPEVRNRETKMIEKTDAAKERIEKLKAELTKAKESKNKALVDKLMPLIGGQKPLYNMDNNHHCNAINENGEIGVLKLRHKAKLALEAVMKQLRAKGVEPLGADDGRFFVINRTGTALETTFSVSVLTKEIDVPGIGKVQQEVVHKLTDDIINRLETEASDLDNLYKRLTSEEVARIVAESDLMTGKSRAVDEIFDKKGSAAEQTGEEEIIEDEPESEAPAPQAAAPAPTQAAAPAPAPTTTLKVDNPPAPTPAPSITEMSDDEFLKSLQA